MSSFLKIPTTFTLYHISWKLVYCPKPPLTCTVSSLCSNCSLVPMVLSTVPSLSWISSSQAQTPWRVSPKAWLSWQHRSLSLAAFSRAWCSIWSWPVTLTSPPDPRSASDREWASWQRRSMESLTRGNDMMLFRIFNSPCYGICEIWPHTPTYIYLLASSSLWRFSILSSSSVVSEAPCWLSAPRTGSLLRLRSICFSQSRIRSAQPLKLGRRGEGGGEERRGEPFFFLIKIPLHKYMTKQE